jgi:hypothetical protein
MKSIDFKNTELYSVARIAIGAGFKVWTFKTSSKYISQIYVTDDKNIITCQAEYSGVKFSTVHKPNKSVGTGFGINEEHVINVTVDDIKSYLKITCPNWVSSKDIRNTQKWANFDEWLKYQTILKWYELK